MEPQQPAAAALAAHRHNRIDSLFKRMLEDYEATCLRTGARFDADLLARRQWAAGIDLLLELDV